MSEGMRVLIFCGFAAVQLLCSVSPCAAKEPRSATEYFRRGLERYAANDYDGAIEDFTSAIVVNSGIDSRTVKRMKLAHSNGDGHSASALLKKVMVMDRFNAAAYFHCGSARLMKGDAHGAIQDLDKAIAVDARNTDAFANRGIAKHRAGDAEGALRDFNRAIELDPRRTTAYNNRGTLRFYLKDLEGAIADFTRAVEIDPRMAEAYHNRGNVYDALGELKTACVDFDKAIELDPALLSPYMSRGLTLVRLGRDAEAERDLTHYLRHVPSSKGAIEKLVREARDSRRRQ